MTQRWSTDTYETHARFVSEYGAAVIDWLAPQPGERILDLGCGDGALTVEIARTGAIVQGVDSSPEFIATARSRGLDAEVGDGRVLGFDGAFDAVFSNAALHWMTEPERVAASVFRALKPGGRFVAEMGGHGNVAAIVTALLAAADRFGLDEQLACPWYFPTPEVHRQLLEATGFEVDEIVLFPRPTRLPSDIAGWLETFRKPLFEAAGARHREALDFVTRLLAPSLCDRAGVWTADYVRLRFRAHRG